MKQIHRSILPSLFGGKANPSSKKDPQLRGFSSPQAHDERMVNNAPLLPLYILNGPNLNLLGQRDTKIYGQHTLDEIEECCRSRLHSIKQELVFRQTNHEGVLIDWVQEAQERAAVLLINGGGLTHTSVSLLDALSILTIPIIEIHLSQPLQREPFRHQSYISPAAHGIVAGFGINSYILAVEAAKGLLVT